MLYYRIEYTRGVCVSGDSLCIITCKTSEKSSVLLIDQLYDDQLDKDELM